MKKYSINKNAGCWLAAIALMLASCSDYLDKQPSVSSDAPITDAAQLFALIDYVSNTYETNAPAVFMTDDCGLSMGLIDAYATLAPQAYYTAFFSDGIAAQASDGLWSGEYKKIYACNTIIAAANSVTDPVNAKEALANAYFCRAWSYYTLAQYYCLPYCEQNKGELGLPLRLGQDFEESLSRSTLEETYNQIFADLKEAESISQNAVDPDKRWRASKCAVNAFYARLYLTMGDYQQALNYANQALGNAPALFDYNTFKEGRSTTYAASQGMPEQTLYYCETNQWSAANFLYFGEYIFTRFTYTGNQWMIPSSDLLASYDQTNDLRFKWFMIPHSNRRFNTTYDEYRYDQLYDGRYAFSGLSTADLMLTKAECEVRLGNWQQGLKDLDDLRAHRYVTGTDSKLTASSQSDALKQVLAERRREFPFSLRMSDIKRYSVNDTSEDDVTITRDFYEMSMTGPVKSNVKHFSVKGNDPLLAVPITDVEINASGGQIQQNPY